MSPCLGQADGSISQMPPLLPVAGAAVPVSPPAGGGVPVSAGLAGSSISPISPPAPPAGGAVGGGFAGAVAGGFPPGFFGCAKAACGNSIAVAMRSQNRACFIERPLPFRRAREGDCEGGSSCLTLQKNWGFRLTAKPRGTLSRFFSAEQSLKRVSIVGDARKRRPRNDCTLHLTLCTMHGVTLRPPPPRRRRGRTGPRRSRPRRTLEGPRRVRRARCIGRGPSARRRHRARCRPWRFHRAS